MHTTTRIGETIGDYTLLREIGRGGMSVVYEARDGRDGLPVALKLLALPTAFTPEQQRDLIARFGREARAVARLSHPAIIAIRDVGEQDGQHFLVMEHLAGQTLRQRLESGPLTPSEAAPILSQVAEAVDAVHAAGVVHRDIKPSNVMLLPDGTAKLLDFGVARQSDDTTITSTGAIVGSPAYMAPEQVRGESGTPATDLWALGVLLYEMLTGRPPFPGNSIPSVLYQVTHEAPAPMTELPPSVQRVLRRALEKEPQRRYPTARALADALRAAVPQPRPARTVLLPPHFALPPRLPRRSWAAALLPVLLGLGLVGLTRYRATTPARPSVPLSAPSGFMPAPAVPRRTAPTRSRPVAITKHRPAQVAKRVHKRAHTLPKHRQTGPIRHHVLNRRPVARRRHLRLRHLHFTRRRAGGRFSPAASARLQQFIYSPGP